MTTEPETSGEYESGISFAELWPEAVALADDIRACDGCDRGRRPYCATHTPLVAAHHQARLSARTD